MIKPRNQIWIAWCSEPEKKHPWINNFELLSQQTISYCQKNKKCIDFFDFKSESIYERYIEELKKYIEIDTFAKLFKNLHNSEGKEKTINEFMLQSPDDIIEKKRNFYCNYKFVIAFENAIEPDFVTDKFYDPLIAGLVPIYFGAPNIDDFAPGDNCFVDVRQYKNPQSLANFINACCEDEQLYAQFF